MMERLRMLVPLFIIASLLSVIISINAQADDFPGPYCATIPGGCCRDRVDGCAVPISTTLCYCDEFCDQYPKSDCCPDYESFCLGIDRPENITLKCKHNGQVFGQFEKMQDNCNMCTCHSNGKAVCEQNTCLIDENLVENVNSISNSLGWTATKYPEFWGRKYSEGLELRLGTKQPTYKVKGMSKLRSKQGALPRNFNALEEERWAGSISPIVDQGWCGSSWALLTASVASDRFGIHTKGKETVELSAQQLMSCVRKQSGCSGGHLDWAWNYIRKFGLVDDECVPYTAKQSHCTIRRDGTLSSAGCKLPTTVPRNHLYRVGPAYSLTNETDIMIEIQESGPVQATMDVHRDFFAYKSGIYRTSPASRSADQTGFHSVRLIGWGEERVGHEIVKYWIAANSWGNWFGENGLFRIVRGENMCGIESYVLAAWPHAHLKPKTMKSSRRPFF